jgi:hypothetical protein
MRFEQKLLNSCKLSSIQTEFNFEKLTFFAVLTHLSCDKV